MAPQVQQQPAQLPPMPSSPRPSSSLQADLDTAVGYERAPTKLYADQADQVSLLWCTGISAYCGRATRPRSLRSCYPSSPRPSSSRQTPRQLATFALQKVLRQAEGGTLTSIYCAGGHAVQPAERGADHAQQQPAGRQRSRAGTHHACTAQEPACRALKGAVTAPCLQASWACPHALCPASQVKVAQQKLGVDRVCCVPCVCCLPDWVEGAMRGLLQPTACCSWLCLGSERTVLIR